LREYGVVLRDGVLDVEQTSELRTGRHSGCLTQYPPFTYGEERDVYDRDWPTDVILQLNLLLADVPGSLRHHYRDTILEAWGAHRQSGSPKTIRELVQTLTPGALRH
jgi:hypothetical protein